MQISVIVSMCDNREDFFCRSLDSWSNQTIPKKDFEFVIIDDANRTSYEQICNDFHRLYGLNFQFIRIDKSKNSIIPKTFIPVLTGNVGIKQARGEVIVITGPETIQNKNNLKISLSALSRKECLYGLVFKADNKSTEYLKENWQTLKTQDFLKILQIPGIKSECLTTPPHPPAYAYYITVKRQYALDIGGFDERFLEGLCGEDDDFANRMKMFGITPVFEHKIIGIHQNHSNSDNDGIYLNRHYGKGKEFWLHNQKLIKENIINKNIVVNKMTDWGGKHLNIYYKLIGV